MVRPIQRKKAFRLKKHFIWIVFLILLIQFRSVLFSEKETIHDNKREGSPEAQKILKPRAQVRSPYTGTMHIHLFVPYLEMSAL